VQTALFKDPVHTAQ